jgi:GGDEF domain-containing protein
VAAASPRASDHLLRWGGEEFLVVFPNTSVAEASHLAAERLRQAITNHRIDEVGQITATFRVAQYAPRTGTAASATAICCAASCSRPRSGAASRKAWWVVRGSPSMPA